MRPVPHSASAASRSDVQRLFGDVEDEVVVEVLALDPTIAELEEAAAWLAGQGDIVARAGHPQSERIAAILDILDMDEDEDERRAP